MKASMEPRRDSGQALPEFALVLPLFLLLLFAIIQFGITFGAQTAVVSSVRNAARYASTHPIGSAAAATAACAGVTAQLKKELQASVPGYNLPTDITPFSDVSFMWVENPDETPSVLTDDTFFIRMTITVRYPHPLLIPLVGLFVDRLDGAADGRWLMSATETMRIENPPLRLDEGTVPCP
jgi:Flp pilus assembly protein TadG